MTHDIQTNCSVYIFVLERPSLLGHMPHESPHFLLAVQTMIKKNQIITNDGIFCTNKK